MDEQANPTVALFLRIDPELHAKIQRVAAAHQETLTAFARRAFSHELQRLTARPAGRLVADAIRGRTPPQTDSDPQPED